MRAESWSSGALAVTALGTVSSLGWDAASSCAAARAGLLRISPLDDYFGRNPETGDADPVFGHTVSGCTEGFTGHGRLIRLGVAALSDMRHSMEATAWEQTGLVLNLSSDFHQRATGVAAGSSSDSDDEDAVPRAPPETLHHEQDPLLSQLIRLADLPLSLRQCKIIRGDQAGFLHALEAASRMLEQRAISHCIVGGVDSYVDLPVVEALDELRLLKTPSRSHGILPGECASFLQVELLETARRRGAHVECVLGTRALHREAHDRFAERRWNGEALARALAELWQALPEGHLPGRLIGNLTGDERRAYDWGCALTRLRGWGLPSELPAWHTGISFGEIGAATAPMAITLAARAFARGYAGTQNVGIWLSSDNGERGALRVRAPQS